MIAIHGERTRAVAGGVGRRNRGAAGAKHHHFGQPRRLELVEAQRVAIDDIVPVQQADRHRVGHPGMQP
ncbi:Uncharacterised protein [Mycobacterium tuberculosis]|uniref:Uncharacterized protein n=1 Tax=Mycobacterium tuberculosis TaxID=1773 RepID=A0A655AVM1_MYCTX|nr:Uncharacterised protein [Mycobacterium tuberculosis]CPA88250.1 Uncharacterised protein [Mycobacterium tuberculosis]